MLINYNVLEKIIKDIFEIVLVYYSNISGKISGL